MTDEPATGWRRFAVVIAAPVLSILVGFALTFDGPVVWDDTARIVHSRWLLGQFGMLDVDFSGGSTTPYYAPLWELILGVANEFVFVGLRDPVWVRHALTLALFLWGLWALWVLLRRCGVDTSSASLGVAFVFGVIRFGGHAALNVKDAPAATVFLLASVATWLILQRCLERSRTWSLVGLGVVAALPFLVRVPLLLHLAGVWALCLAIAVGAPKLGVKDRLRWALIPGLSGVAIIVALYPPFWTTDLAQWTEPFSRFGDHKIVVMTRVLGLAFPSNEVPWWYGLLWIPVIVHPVVLILSLVGALAPLKEPKPLCAPLELRLGGRCVKISLRTWLWLIVAASWAAVMIRQPSLYDEERHILFLFPPLVLVCALGLNGLQDKAKFAIAAVVTVAALGSYAWWGRYAYVYKSPIIGERGSELFLGDYWGACIGEAVTVVPEFVPPKSPVKVDGPSLSAGLVEQRYKWAALSADPTFGPYAWLGHWVMYSPLAAISFNRPYIGDDPGPEGALARHQAEVDAGRAQMVWSTDMPTGEHACAIFVYPEGPPRARSR